MHYSSGTYIFTYVHLVHTIKIKLLLLFIIYYCFFIFIFIKESAIIFTISEESDGQKVRETLI